MIKSFHINDRGGTGKSYMIKAVMKHLDKNNLKYRCFAPTSKVISLLGDKEVSETLDKFYNIYISNKNKMPYEFLIVDEISMMRTNFYRMIGISLI